MHEEAWGSWKPGEEHLTVKQREGANDTKHDVRWPSHMWVSCLLSVLRRQWSGPEDP